MIFYTYIKMVIKYYKKQKRASERSMWEAPISFQRSKRKQTERVPDRYKNLSEEEKQKKLSIWEIII